jgi:predicted RNA methylase
MKKREQDTLRFRKARNAADQRGQVYTPKPIAHLLASMLPLDTAVILDVGAGRGALAYAALDRLKRARAILLENDSVSVRRLRAFHRPRTSVVSANALEQGAISAPSLKVGRLAFLSNPPYGMLKLDSACRDEAHELQPVIDGVGWTRGDAAFVSSIWPVAPNGSCIGLIVSAAIVCSPAYADYRRKLVMGLANLHVVELHPKAFAGAEVRAFLIVGTRAIGRQRNVLLSRTDINGEITHNLEVSHSAAIQRVDYGYHAAIGALEIRADHFNGSLADLGGLVQRGSRSNGEFSRLGHNAFHTTHFAHASEHLRLAGAEEGFLAAKSGDILIPRVGTRCLQHEARVAYGSGLITDCVYRIRAPKDVRNSIWKTIRSDFGREWRLLHADGSCAKYLTMSSVGAMPILNF